MRFVLRAEDGALDLRFDDRDEAARFFDQAEEQKGFFLQLERPLELFAKLDLRAIAPDLAFECRIEVMQRFPGAAGYGTAFRLSDWSDQRPKLDRALGRVAEAATTARGAAGGGEPTSPIFKIKKMNPAERFRLAMRAGRVERQILLRDTSPQVLMGLLSHPRIEDSEVIDIVKSSYASAGVMQRVADSNKWMTNADIRVIVVRSPKTPPQVALKHLPLLRTSELKMMAKGGARELLRRAAIKEYLKRTGRNA